jgi:hypothetical protein
MVISNDFKHLPRRFTGAIESKSRLGVIVADRIGGLTVDK